MGEAVGSTAGEAVGSSVGETAGSTVGEAVGPSVGEAGEAVLGSSAGETACLTLGEAVGSSVPQYLKGEYAHCLPRTSWHSLNKGGALPRSPHDLVRDLSSRTASRLAAQAASVVEPLVISAAVESLLST